MDSKEHMDYSDFDTIEFENIKDFNLIHIFECGQVFRWIPACGDGSVYTGAAGSHVARVSFHRDTLKVQASGGDSDFWRDYFDLDTDYEKIKRDLAYSEPGIKAATEQGSGIRILRQNLFETIISFIMSQNNNIPRIRKCIEVLCEKYGDKVSEINDRTLHAFPSPEVLASAKLQDLQDLKFGYRSEYIKESARKYLEDGPPVCREDLLAMHGIGPKVADCIMLFGMRDMAAFPIDTWMKHIMKDMYDFEESDIKGMSEFAARKFGDFAGYAQQYLFYYYRDRGVDI